MLTKILDDIRNQKITPTAWVFSFIGILFIRFMFESLSSPSSDGIITSDAFTIIHYVLFFLCTTLGTSLILGKLIKNYEYAIKILLFGLPLLWLAPVIDLILSGGRGYKMLYLFDSGKNLVLNFLTFFGPILNKGATYGIRIELALSLIGIGYIIWLITKNIKNVILGIICVYILVFLGASIPGVVYSISNIKHPTTSAQNVVTEIRSVIENSNLSHNTLREVSSTVSEDRLFELEFNKFISQILFVFSFIFGLILFYKIDKNKFKSIIENSRPERINFYTASLFCGVGFAYINGLGREFVLTDLWGFACLFLAWVCLWMHAVHVNDIVDIEIDKISNTNRPLVKDQISSSQMQEIGNIWLFAALLGAWSAGFYPFYMCLVYVSASYIYSSPPLRLRRFPLAPSFLIGVACLATILAGFFFVSTNKQIQTFPILLSIGIVIMVTLAINFKDIKDIEGDRKNGIITLPILFGQRGVQIVAVLFALSILLVPIFLSFWFLYIICLPAGIIGYRLIMKKPFNEKPIFILRFFFLGGIGLIYILIYWMAHIYKLI